MARNAETIVRLAILDGYKVRWDRRTIARDVVQNFFDEVDDFDEVKIEVDDADGTVRVSGPSVFHVDYLRYLGASTKTSPAKRSAGGFGEGFKICALVLLRDYRAEVEAASGRWRIRVFFAEHKLGRELCYALRRVGPRERCNGSEVRLTSVDKRLRDEFRVARDLFRHPRNPKLAHPIHVDDRSGIGLYASPDGARGAVFYRRQLRGELRYAEGHALSLAYDDRIEAIDADRDRREFSAVAPLASAVCARLPDDVLRDVVQRLRRYWGRGHRLLACAVAEAARRKIQIAFPRRWLARSKEFRLNDRALRNGRLLATARMARLGMPTVDALFGGQELPRLPTPIERARLRVAAALYQELSGRSVSANPRVLDAAISSLPRSYGAKVPVVHAAHLALPYRDAIGLVLSQLAFRAEHSLASTNGDRMTALLAGLLEKPDLVAKYAARWRSARPIDDPDDRDAPVEDMKVGAGFVQVLILAPSWLPPALELHERVKSLAPELPFAINPLFVEVNGPWDAARQAADGVVDVWVGEAHLDAKSDRGARFELRTYPGPKNQPALVPSLDSIRRVLVEQARGLRPKVRRAIGLDRWGARARVSFEHFLKDYPHDAARHALRRFVHHRQREGPICDIEGAWGIASAAAIAEGDAAIAGGETPSEARMVAWFDDAGAWSLDVMTRALAGVGPRGLEGELADPTLAHLGDTAQRQFRAGSGRDRVERYLLASVRDAAALLAECERLPLDDHCRSACLRRALDRYLETFVGDLGDALGRARAELAAASVVAQRRHEIVPPGGRCWVEASAFINRELGVLGAVAQRDAHRAEEIQRLRAAWESAVAAGRSEVEATADLMEASRVLDRVGGAE